jgi:hypothetical protein
MRRCNVILMIALLTSLVSASAIGQERVAVVNRDDPEIQRMITGGTTLLGPNSGGLESSSASELEEVTLPVIGLLPSQLGIALSVDDGSLESLDDGSDPQFDLKKIVPNILIGDDKLAYSIEYNIADSLFIECSGTRKINKTVVNGLPPKSNDGTNALQGDDTEITSITKSQVRYGEVLYSCNLECVRTDLLSYCQNDKTISNIMAKIKLLAPGKQ